MIGPGYTSLGVPNLRTDQFGYEGKFEQRFFKKRVSLSTFIRSFEDNLINWKSSTTTVTTYGINFGINIPRLPFLRISFTPTNQYNNVKDTLSKVDNQITVYSVISGYTFYTGGLSFTTTLSVNGQKLEMPSKAGKYSTNSYMIGEMINLSLPMMIGVNYGLIETTNFLGYNLIHNMELSCQAPINDIFMVGGGLTFASERSNNERIGFYANSTINIGSNLFLDIRLENNTYNDFIFANTDYNEFLFRTNLGFNF
jgi:hypothetical protein